MEKKFFVKNIFHKKYYLKTLDANIAALAAPEAVEAVDPTAEQEIERE